MHTSHTSRAYPFLHSIALVFGGSAVGYAGSNHTAFKVYCWGSNGHHKYNENGHDLGIAAHPCGTADDPLT